MVVAEADHMEAIGHDHSLGKVVLDDGAVPCGQVHAGHADLVFAFQAKEIRL